MDDLIAAIVDVREKLGQGLFSSEDQVSKGVVMRLLQKLGWDVFDPARVSSEFRIGNRKVDYALLHAPFGPVVLIEVKDVGKATPKGEDQLFDYCSKQGVPLAVLSDGRSWSFYLPAGMGSYEQRRFAVLDLLEDDKAECSRLLTRYVGFEAVVSGQSHQDAQSDYQNYRQQIVAREQFSPVLESLIAEADPRVVALFRDEVARRCGHRPEDADVKDFLRNQFVQMGQTPGPPPTPSQPERNQAHKATQIRRAPGVRTKGSRSASAPSESPSFSLFGQTVSCSNDIGVLVGVLTALGERDPGFYERLAPRLHGRKRQHLSRDRHQIYPPGSDEKVLTALRELPGGWWVATNTSTRTKVKQLEKARVVAGIRPNQLNWRMKGKG